METKKSPKANLEKKRFLFLELGLVLALGICFAAFEWSSEEVNTSVLGDLSQSTDIEDDMVNVKLPEPPPPPPAEKDISPERIIITEKPVVSPSDIFTSDPLPPTYPVITQVVPVDLPPENLDPVDYVKVEFKPVFPGGDEALLKFIKENTKYPEIPKSNGVEGKVFVRFIIDTKGKVTNVSLMNDIDPYLNAEAMRVVALLPPWTPGKQRDKFVPVSYIIPINFKLY